MCSYATLAFLMKTMIPQILTDNLPLFTIIAAYLGVVWMAIVASLMLVDLTAKAYNKMLRSWTPKGWYFSMCMLISDMARNKTKWQEFHVAKVTALLMGLRKENPELFFKLTYNLDEIRRSAAVDLQKDSNVNEDDARREDFKKAHERASKQRKPLSLG